MTNRPSLIMALVGVIGCGPVAAQQIPSAGRVLESVQEKAPPPRKAEDQVLEKQPDLARPAPITQAARTIRVTGFRIQGNTVFSEQALLALLTPYINKDLTLDGLNEAAEVIKNHYRDKQYFLANAYLPPQQIKDGVVTIQILEGRIGKVGLKMAGNARLKEGVARNILDAHLPAGSSITETGIEKPLLLTNDLPGVIVRSTLKPGAGVGEADLDVSVGDEGRLFNGSVELDNMGNRNTGKNRLTGTVNARNLTGYGDLLTIRALLAEDMGTTLGRVSYAMPVGPKGDKIIASYSNLGYELGEAFASLNADGTADVYSLYVQHPVIRSRNSNLFLFAGYERKELVDKKFSGASREERRLDNLLLSLRGDFRDDLLGGALNSYNAGITAGKLENTLVAADPHDTQGNFVKFNFEYKRLQNLAEHTTLLLGAAGQFASKNLAAAEQLSLGGPYGVRSHPVGEASGDDAIYGTVEVRRVLAGIKPLGGTLQVKAFYDIGYAKGRHDPLPSDTNNTHTLRGYGLGVNLARRDDFLLAADLAFRAGERSSDDDRDYRLWFQAIKWF